MQNAIRKFERYVNQTVKIVNLVCVIRRLSIIAKLSTFESDEPECFTFTDESVPDLLSNIRRTPG
jgi:hypothetical protein